MPSNANILIPAFSPLDLQSRSRLWQVAAIVLGTLFLALSSYVEVPMVPVPMTMQTFAVTMVGALYGWRLGALTIIAWLAEAVVGLPVLAGGASGIQHFMGVYDSLNTAKARPVTAAYGQLQDAFRTAFVDIANGVPVKDALTSAVEKFEAAASRVAQ